MPPVVTKSPNGGENPDNGKWLDELLTKYKTLFFIFTDVPEKKKRKRSRWTADDEKTCIPGMPTIIPGNMTQHQEKAYLSKNSFVKTKYK